MIQRLFLLLLRLLLMIKCHKNPREDWLAVRKRKWRWRGEYHPIVSARHVVVLVVVLVIAFCCLSAISLSPPTLSYITHKSLLKNDRYPRAMAKYRFCLEFHAELFLLGRTEKRRSPKMQQNLFSWVQIETSETSSIGTTWLFVEWNGRIRMDNHSFRRYRRDRTDRIWRRKRLETRKKR